MGVVNSNRVTFPAGTKLKYGTYGTAAGALSTFGLLGGESTLNLEQTVRQKMDRFPEVVVAEAIQAQQGTMETVLQEWKKDALLMAFGLHDGDVSETAGGDQAVASEAVTFDANDVAVLDHPLKDGESITLEDTDGGGGTTYVEGTDYQVIHRDLEGRTLLYRLSGGGIPSEGTAYAGYTYVSATLREYPIGKVAQVRYWTVHLEEELTNGGKNVYRLHKARIGIRGALSIGQAEGANLPVTIQALYDEGEGEILRVMEHEPS